MPQVLSTSHHFSCSPLLTSQCEIWVSRCFIEDLEEGERREEAKLSSSYSCMQHRPPSPGQAQGLPWPSSSLPGPVIHQTPGLAILSSYRFSHQAQLSFLEGPLFVKKAIFCDTSRRHLFTDLCIQKQHTDKSSAFTHTSDEVGNQSVVGKQHKKKTPGTLTSFTHVEALGENCEKSSKPPVPAVLSKKSSKPRSMEDTQAFSLLQEVQPQMYPKTQGHTRCAGLREWLWGCKRGSSL